MIQGSFEGVNLKRLVGYRIAANWTPIHGFQSYFYVYVWDMQHAPDPFAEAVDVGGKDKPKRGTLTIDGGERTYTFKNIDLFSAQIGVTRRFRYRLLEFRYSDEEVSKGSTPVTLTNNGKDKVELAALGEEYQYSLDDGNENLLGFRTRSAASAASVFRFSTLRNSQNCFLKKMIAANDERNQKKRMSDFTVNFTKGALKVTQENLDSWYIDESFGYLQEEPQPPLLDLVSGDEATRIRKAVSMKMDDFSQRELLKFDVSHDTNPREASSQTIETSTFVFKPGNYQNPKIT